MGRLRGCQYRTRIELDPKAQMEGRGGLAAGEAVVVQPKPALRESRESNDAGPRGPGVGSLCGEPRRLPDGLAW